MGCYGCFDFWFFAYPYKIFTVASGVTGLSVYPFLIASFLGTVCDFFLLVLLFQREVII